MNMYMWCLIIQSSGKECIIQSRENGGVFVNEDNKSLHGKKRREGRELKI